MSTNPIRVVFLGYAGVQTLDLAGPLDAFASANSARAGAYLTLTTSLNGVPFARTGHWPDRAMFAMESRGASTKGSINKQGHFQTEDLMGVEFHVHDTSRFKGGWGFFAGNATDPATQLPYSAACYSCHQAHGAVDTTFTQFYPTAKAIAVKAGTYQEP
jgi:hypothetical protein